MNQTAVFDLKDILVNELFGSSWLFFIIGLILIWVVCLKSKTGIQVPSVLSLVFLGIMLSAYSDFLVVWVFFLLMIGFMLYYTFSTILNR